MILSFDQLDAYQQIGLLGYWNASQEEPGTRLPISEIRIPALKANIPLKDDPGPGGKLRNLGLILSSMVGRVTTANTVWKIEKFGKPVKYALTPVSEERLYRDIIKTSLDLILEYVVSEVGIEAEFSPGDVDISSHLKDGKTTADFLNSIVGYSYTIMDILCYRSVELVKLNNFRYTFKYLFDCE